MSKEVSIDNVFSVIGTTTDFELNIVEPFKKKFIFSYKGIGDTITAKISGNPKKTGIEIGSIVHEADGTYSLTMYGTPKILGKNELTLKLKDNKKVTAKFPVTFQVIPLKIQPSVLPDAYGLFKPYKTKIYFTNPSKQKPKFSINFPIEFGAVNTESDSGENYFTIIFNPSRKGKYKFYVQAFNKDNILLGARTMRLTVHENENDKPEEVVNPEKEQPVTVKAIDFKDWTN